ncbi:MAG: hypothetical protein H0V12_03230 [Chloroflexi bacterium]|nr:hypothetical protein [Chloroflexota bacterium]
MGVNPTEPGRLGLDVELELATSGELGQAAIAAVGLNGLEAGEVAKVLAQQLARNTTGSMARKGQAGLDHSNTGPKYSSLSER